MLTSNTIHKYNTNQSDFEIVHHRTDRNGMREILLKIQSDNILDRMIVSLYEFLFNPRFKFFKSVFGDSGVFEHCGCSSENLCGCNDEEWQDAVPSHEYHMKRCVSDENVLKYLEGCE